MRDGFFFYEAESKKCCSSEGRQNLFLQKERLREMGALAVFESRCQYQRQTTKYRCLLFDEKSGKVRGKPYFQVLGD